MGAGSLFPADPFAEELDVIGGLNCEGAVAGLELVRLREKLHRWVPFDLKFRRKPLMLVRVELCNHEIVMLVHFLREPTWANPFAAPLTTCRARASACLCAYAYDHRVCARARGVPVCACMSCDCGTGRRDTLASSLKTGICDLQNPHLYKDQAQSPQYTPRCVSRTRNVR